MVVGYFPITVSLVIALESFVGEKERGTMETLLCTPAGRTEIVLGKFFMVLTGSLAAMVLALVSMGTSFVLLGASLRGATTGGSELLPVLSLIGIGGTLILILPVAVSFSAIVFTVSLFAKSYKEAQTYVTPLIIAVIMPAVIGMMPGIELNARMALVPILGLSLVCKEMLSGVWHWQLIGLVFASYCLYGVVALSLAVRMFKREDVIFRT
jgi:sodium transport system permease protein